jgi:cell wall-associated NlpC family hydrolase
MAACTRWRRGALLVVLLAGGSGCGAPITARQARETTSNAAPSPQESWTRATSDDVRALARAAAALPEDRRIVVEVALAMAGAEALQFDCSSFTQHVFSLSRTGIPRTTREQFAQGRPVETGDLRAGDLVFFSFSRRPVDHVGIYTGNGSFVHVSSSTRTVRLESLSKAVFASSVVAGASFLEP